MSKSNYSFRKPIIDEETGKQRAGRRVVVDKATALKMPGVINVTARMAGVEFAGRYNSLNSEGERYTDRNGVVVIYYLQDGNDVELDPAIFGASAAE